MKPHSRRELLRSRAHDLLRDMDVPGAREGEKTTPVFSFIASVVPEGYRARCEVAVIEAAVALVGLDHDLGNDAILSIAERGTAEEIMAACKLLTLLRDAVDDLKEMLPREAAE